MPARRWIYSTNKSAHHGGSSGGLHLLGHTCAHEYTETTSRGTLTHTRQVTHFASHTIINSHTCACAAMQVKALHNEIEPTNPQVYVVPSPPVCRNEGRWEEEWIKFANLRWNQSWSGCWMGSWRSASVQWQICIQQHEKVARREINHNPVCVFVSCRRICVFAGWRGLD